MTMRQSSRWSPAPCCTRLPSPSWVPVLIASLLSAGPVHAQLLADAAAPAEQRPSLRMTASGIPQVDITRPSAAGVSVNQFRQFDIAPDGAVINNGRKASSTSLAGWVAANPALLAGEARVIVNEVRSNDPSRLQGYVEIAGGKADLIIANPSGIHCNGCGFIHAARVELATAKPTMDDGKLTGYAMGHGPLEIAGRGLDASRVDALSLLTQAARVNADIWANDLRLELKAPPGAPDTPAAPSFALDVAEIGGMYANRIWLVGSAHGLGVRNAGNWSARETLQVTLDGKLQNSAGIDAREVMIQATSLDNVAHGKILGQRITLQADRIANAGHPEASPVIAAAADLDIAVRALENTDKARIVSGNDMRIGRQTNHEGHATGMAELVLNRDASIDAQRKLRILSGQLKNLNAGVEVAEVRVAGPQRMVYIQPSGEDRKYLQEELDAAGRGKTHTYSRTEYVLDRTEHESRVVSSKPARIMSGGDMYLAGQQLLNADSQIIAGGELTGTLDNLRTTETPGTTRIQQTGTSQTFLVKAIPLNLFKSVAGPVLPYLPADEVRTRRLSLAATADKQAGRLPTPAFDLATSKLALEGSSLFQIKPGAGPLLITDPRFTQYRTWLNSDLMLAQLDYDPERLHKRIGDGYIEQQIVIDQIAQLTGRRFLPGQDNDEAQFAALMNHGVRQAAALHLQPGIALTATQIAKLTSDIVWLVEQDLPVPARDGLPEQTIRVLMPRVYLLPRAGDLDGDGTLISAQRVALSVADAIENAGTINGTEGLQLQARMISHSGTLTGDTALLTASDDIHILGGDVSTLHQQQLRAGRDIRIASSTRDSRRQSLGSQATAEADRTSIDRIAMLHIAGPGDLQMLAGRDIVVDAAQLMNHGSGNIAVIANRDLILGTLTTRSSLSAGARGSANVLREAQSTEVGTSTQANGSILMAAGRDLATRATSVDSRHATVALSAERDLTITAGESSASFAQGTEFRRHGFFSSSTSTRRTSTEQKNALASVISGNTVNLHAGQDLSIAGSDVTGDLASRLQAGRDVSLKAATESALSASFSRDTRSGLFSGPGLSLGIGSQRQHNTSEWHSTRQRGSQVGTLAGDVRIDAGDSYRQQASSIVAPRGSVAITATHIDIAGGTDTSDSKQASSFSQSGLSITLSNPVINAGRTLESLHDAIQMTRSSRAQTLAAAAAGLAVANTANEVAKDPSHAGGVTLSVTLGSSKSASTATEHATRVAPSVLTAGGNVDVRAQGRPDARLAVTGSQIAAADTATLKSDGELVLDAQAGTRTESMSNHSSSAGIGLAASTGKDGTSLGIIVSASKAKGKAAGDDSRWTNMEITAGRRASLRSEGDSRLTGAIVKAPTIEARVGGNLLIESLQDSSRYDSDQQSYSGSVTMPLPGGGSPSAQFNTSKSAIHSNYLSTNEISGLQAGDGGFQVEVTGKTELKAAVIASTDAAVKARSNRFSSAQLAMSDLKNHADYDAKAYGAGVGIGRNPTGNYVPKGNHAGVGSDSDDQSGVTTAGISGVAGHQNVRTGDPSSGVVRIFDAERVAQEINAQVRISQEFSGHAYKAVEDHVSRRRSELNRALRTAKESKDEKEQQSINASLSELRREEQVMNILIGAVIGLGGSAVTKEGLSSAAEKMRALMIEDSRKFAGVTDGKTVISNMTGESEGVRSDGVKLGGTRIDPDLSCGKNNEHCEVVRDSGGKPVLDADGKTILALNDQQMIVFITSEKYPSLQSYLDSDEGLKMHGPTGGIQGYKATLFGMPYLPGSWQDKLIEAFAGAHDYLGGKLPGMYDSQGNIKRGMPRSERDSLDRGSVAAIIPSTPFAMAEFLSPAVWSAISIMLKAAR